MSVLRRVAARLIRGPDAPWILNDLEELMSRDLERGMSAGRARRRYARNAIGSAVSTWRARRREPGSLVSWLDVKLGLRMLVKYPVLSLVSVLGMTVAIAIGAGSFSAIYSMMDPTLPLPGGESVVALQNSTRNPGNPHRQSLHDFVLWRDELSSVRDLSAFMADSRNLVAAPGDVALVQVAQMTASGFRVARVAPVQGRPLLEEDERYGAAPVVVIAYEEWQRRFNGDADIIGRSVRLGTEMHTIVGVMPEGFRFPINHRFWVPLRLDPAEHERGGGPAIHMFGRLAEGTTIEEAQAELTAIGLRMAAQYPDTHEYLRPRMMPYTLSFMDIDSPAMAMMMHAIQFAISLLLILVSVNIAVLVYARTATRTGEIAVRSALGASRRRIVTQLFAEALVISGIAAVIGLTIAGYALAKTQQFLDDEQDLPFWLDLGLSPGTVAYVAGLAILAGAIVGVLPALKATGRQLQGGLQQLSARGSQMQLGRTWTALIVAQVAIAVAVLPFAIYIAGQSYLRGTAEAGYPAGEVLRAELSVEQLEAPPVDRAAAYEEEVQARYRTGTAELLRRLDAEPAVAGVSFATSYPGGGRSRRIEVEPEDEAARAAQDSVTPGVRGVLVSQVGVDLFDVLDVPVIAGRHFVEADAREGANTAIVDRVLAESLLGGSTVLGRRVRVITLPPTWGPQGPIPFDPAAIEAGPWLEIVGVVPDFTVQNDFDPANPKLYQPMSLEAAGTTILSLALRIRGTPAPAFGARLREITAAVDPALQLHGVKSAAEAQRTAQLGLRFIAFGIAAVTLSVLLLSAAGIYAMMSFTVAKRRREIGIRAALGAAPQRVIRGIFARAGAQLAAGVLVGLLLSAVLGQMMGGGPLTGRGLLLLPAVAAIMVTVGLLAALVPARRCLSVQPTEALQSE